MLRRPLGSVSVDLHTAYRIDGHRHSQSPAAVGNGPTCVPTILAPMTEERRPKSKPTEDRKLLRSAPYADPSFLDSDAWRALRIQGEVIEGFDSLARLGPAVSIFGSARTHPDDPMYVQARRGPRRPAGAQGHHGHHRRRPGDHGGRQQRRGGGWRRVGRASASSCRTSRASTSTATSRSTSATSSRAS